MFILDYSIRGTRINSHPNGSTSVRRKKNLTLLAAKVGIGEMIDLDDATVLGADGTWWRLGRWGAVPAFEFEARNAVAAASFEGGGPGFGLLFLIFVIVRR